jgi:hypothetical protein
VANVHQEGFNRWDLHRHGRHLLRVGLTNGVHTVSVKRTVGDVSDVGTTSSWTVEHGEAGQAGPVRRFELADDLDESEHQLGCSVGCVWDRSLRMLNGWWLLHVCAGQQARVRHCFRRPQSCRQGSGQRRQCR